MKVPQASARRIMSIPLVLGESGFKRATESLVFDPTQLKCKGFAYRDGGGIYLVRITSLQTTDGGIGIDPQEISEYGEDEEMSSLYDLKCPILGQKVEDEDGTSLGKVADAVIDLGAFYVTQIALSGSPKKLIYRSLVISVSSDAIVVKSGTQRIKDESRVRNSIPDPVGA